MRKWGLIITLVYIALLLILVVPAIIFFGLFPRVKTASQLYEATMGMRSTPGQHLMRVAISTMLFALKAVASQPLLPNCVQTLGERIRNTYLYA